MHGSTMSPANQYPTQFFSPVIMMMMMMMIMIMIIMMMMIIVVLTYLNGIGIFSHICWQSQ